MILLSGYPNKFEFLPIKIMIQFLKELQKIQVDAWKQGWCRINLLYVYQKMR